MNLKEAITEQMKAAMKNREKVQVAAIRLIRDAIQKAELSKNREFDDAQVVAVLAKLVKQREESITAFEKGGRQDLAEREKLELSIIRSFMPKTLTPEELTDLVAKAVKESEAKSFADLGKVMKALKGKYEGMAGGKEVSEEAKRQLAALSGP
jgi:hypothetical protein